jgi:hypothetical protein
VRNETVSVSATRANWASLKYAQPIGEDKTGSASRCQFQSENVLPIYDDERESVSINRTHYPLLKHVLPIGNNESVPISTNRANWVSLGTYTLLTTREARVSMNQSIKGAIVRTHYY